MPLSKIGREILRKMQEEYGKKRGTAIFYAWEKKHRDLVLKRKK